MAKSSLELPPDDELDWRDALEQCNRIAELCDDIPERGEEFADSVREKAENYASWIRKNKEVTRRMQEALDNMEAGVNRWLD